MTSIYDSLFVEAYDGENVPQEDDEEIIMLQRSDGYWNLFNVEKEYMIPGNYKQIHRLRSVNCFHP